MKVIRFASVALVLLFAVLVVSACSSTSYAQNGAHHRVDLDRTNFWQYMTITQVRVNPVVGTRLQIFPNDGDFTFNAVIITYLVYTTPMCRYPERRMLQINRNGRGESMPCTQLFPRVVSITGRVEFWR